MIVRSLKVLGIRSWEEGQTTFQEGFTAIVGPKGVGKSSLIDALEFALFGRGVFPDYGHVMREGATNALVELTVEDSGKTFIIKRGLIRTSTGISQDPSNLSITVNGVIYTRNKVTDLDRDVKEFLKIDRDLLEFTCLARQEELKSILNMRPQERKNIIDALLQLDAFEKARNELGKVVRGRKEYLKAYKEMAAKYDLTELSKKYDQTIEAIDNKRKKRNKLKEQLQLERKKLERINAEIKKFEEAAKEFRKLKNEMDKQKDQLSREQGEAEGIKGQIKTHRTTLKNLKKKVKSIEKQLSDFWTQLFENGYRGEKSLDSLSKTIENLNNELQNLSNSISIDQKTLDEEESKEKELSGREDCPYCGQPLSTHKAGQFRRERLRRIEELRGSINNKTKEYNEKLARIKVFKDYQPKINRFEDRINQYNGQIEDHEQKIKELQKKLKPIELEIEDLRKQIKALERSLPPYDEKAHELKQKEQLEQSNKVIKLEGDLKLVENDLQQLSEKLNDLSNKIKEGKKIHEKLETRSRIVDDLEFIRKGCTAVLPDLRSMYLKAIQSYVQKIYNLINPMSPFYILIDENYSPKVKVGGYTRSYRSLSGGERTEIALAYRIGLGNAIYEARTGSPMELLILDEPTENLGNEEEDPSIENLAKMLTNLNVRQIIAVTHDQTFAKYAEHTIQIRKINERSRIVP